MHYFSIICKDAPDSNTKRRALRTAHLERLKQLQIEQRLLIAGPYYAQSPINDDTIDGHIIGDIIIAKFATQTEANEWAAADPFVTAGIYLNIDIHPFNPTISDLL